jgi:hypothetical protein
LVCEMLNPHSSILIKCVEDRQCGLAGVETKIDRT